MVLDEWRKEWEFPNPIDLVAGYGFIPSKIFFSYVTFSLESFWH